MAEPPKDAGNRELLERIVSLEGENAGLVERVNDLEKRAGNNHKFMMDLIDRYRLIDEQVLELMEKVFPGHCRTQSQIIQIFKSKDNAE
jgi:hypothetical protein